MRRRCWWSATALDVELPAATKASRWGDDYRMHGKVSNIRAVKNVLCVEAYLAVVELFHMSVVVRNQTGDPRRLKTNHRVTAGMAELFVG